MLVAESERCTHHGGVIPVPTAARVLQGEKGGGVGQTARSDAVVAVHVTTYVPQDHVEDKQDGEDE